MDEISHPQSEQSIGSRLSQARIQAGLNVGDISERIKFSVQQIEALENNQFEQLGLVFSRGFLRSYARALDLDANALINDLPNLSAAQTSRLNIHDEQIDLNQRNSLWKIVAGTIILLTILIAPWFIYRWLSRGNVIPVTSSKPVSTAIGLLAPRPTAALLTSSTTSTMNLPNAISVPTPAITALNFKAEPDTHANTPMTNTESNTSASGSATSGLTTSMATTPKPTTANASVPTPLISTQAVSNSMASSSTTPTPSISPPQASNGASSSSSVAPIQNLELQFNGKAWVSIRDEHHHILTSHLYQAGQHATFSAPAPLSLVIGNAAQVSLSDNGQAINLLTHIKNRVAILTLGSTNQ